ncbi:ankyrin repeat-containing domain protein [Morchella snyderi]|nr:ankyrin repeat-containing domain protein [Morchella snyderi]
MCWPRPKTRTYSVDHPIPTPRHYETSLPPLPHFKLLSLPPELLLGLADYLPLGTIFHLHLCCHRLHSLLLPTLAKALPHHAQHVMEWAITYNSPAHLTRAVAAGAIITARQVLYIVRVGILPLLAALLAACPDYNLNERHNQKRGPLHEATLMGRKGCVTILLRAGALPDFPDSDGRTSLLYALYTQNRGVARMLLAAGATREARGLDEMLWAVVYWPGMVKVLAEAGWGGGTGLGQTTPLQLAVRLGRLEVARVLLKAGAGVDELGDGRGTGWAPLHECVLHRGSEQMMDLLLRNGAKVGVLGGASVAEGYRAPSGEEMGLGPFQMARRARNWSAVVQLMSYKWGGNCFQLWFRHFTDRPPKTSYEFVMWGEHYNVPDSDPLMYRLLHPSRGWGYGWDVDFTHPSCSRN